MNILILFCFANIVDNLFDGKIQVRIDGPYGEANQDWHRFQVTVFVAGGIGVTPYASILKDIAHRASSGITIYSQKVALPFNLLLIAAYA